jgi:hypothetical protein
MSRERGPVIVPFLIAAAMVVLPSAAYVGAYLGLSTRTTRDLRSGYKCRIYSSYWQAMIFVPAALAESAMTGEGVSPGCPLPKPGR